MKSEKSNKIKMLTQVSPIFSFICILCLSSHAVNIAGTSIPDTLNTASQTLVLNGAGIRTKWGFKIYAGGLYLLKKSSNADSIIKADEPMAVRLCFVSGLVTGDKLEASIREGFTKSTKGNAPELENRIETFITVFTKKVNKGDVYDLVYIPGHGTDVFRNGDNLAIIKGLDFKKALFAIWLGIDPAHKKLKECMLGNLITVP